MGKSKGSSAPKGGKAGKTSSPRPIPAQAGVSDQTHGSGTPPRKVPPVGAATDPHEATPRPVIGGSPDGVTGAPLRPVRKWRPDQAGKITPKAMDSDAHAE